MANEVYGEINSVKKEKNSPLNYNLSIKNITMLIPAAKMINAPIVGQVLVSCDYGACDSNLFELKDMGNGREPVCVANGRNVPCDCGLYKTVAAGNVKGNR